MFTPGSSIVFWIIVDATGMTVVPLMVLAAVCCVLNSNQVAPVFQHAVRRSREDIRQVCSFVSENVVHPVVDEAIGIFTMAKVAKSYVFDTSDPSSESPAFGQLDHPDKTDKPETEPVSR